MAPGNGGHFCISKSFFHIGFTFSRTCSKVLLVRPQGPKRKDKDMTMDQYEASLSTRIISEREDNIKTR